MTISRDLFLTILSMDSYNRGYGPGVNMPSNGRLGKASIVTFPGSVSAGWEDAGFYAIAYDVTGIAGLSGTVISYRGSDTFVDFPWDDDPVGGDLWNGYGIALGYPDGPQARLAIKFYQAVADSLPGVNNLRNADITLTGHSLGAGIAGLVAGIYNRPGFFVDPMPFGDAVDQYFSWLTFADPSAVLNQEFVDFVLSGNVAWGRETAAYFRGTYIANIPGTLSNNLDVYRTVFGTDTGAPLTPLLLPTDVPLTTTKLNKVGQAHNNALIVMRMFVRDLATSNPAIANWTLSARYVLPILFNNDFAAEVGAGAIDATGRDPSGALRDAIAYSAIDEGERPFGDVAIRAMFQDAADFGRALDKLPSLVDGSVKYAIGKTIVEFAGLMALRDVEADQLASSAPNVLNGALQILTESENGETSDAALRINFSNELWSVGGGLHQAQSKEWIIDSLLSASDAEGSYTDLASWYSRQTGYSLAGEIDEVIISLKSGRVFLASTPSCFVSRFGGCGWFAADNDNENTPKQLRMSK
jgi:hypothetical protein